jgi:hypothetical protein
VALFFIVPPFSLCFYSDSYSLNPFSRLLVSITMEIVDPAQIPKWDKILLNTPGYSFFHSSSWARVLKESYDYSPKYFVGIEDGHFSCLVPIMEIDSFLTGKRGVSLPFTDSVEPIVRESGSSWEMFNHILAFGNKRGWKHIELRGGGNLFPQTPAFVTYIGHTLDLSKKEEEIFSNFRDSTRRNIKKALSQGVSVKIHHDPDAVEEFCRLNSMTRKIHGLPPQPFSFFRKFYEHIISQGAAFVALALHQDRPVAGAVFCHFGNKAIFKYGASDPKYLHLRANNLIMWEGIRWFRQKGCKSLCFGRTEPENAGLGQYKTGWGVEEKTLPYFKFDLNEMEFITRYSRRYALSSKIFQRMPVSALNLIGSIFYRHMG